ncbi:MAG: methylcobalamin:coenzyme M methyltransferase [bacterium ADurb.Bin429]|nr:MAG: methylcobalamin:coenzyme M methyltransferase [bacterium ADurb.Bin429]
MALTIRENFLRNASMTGPEWMPVYPAISGASWAQLGVELEEVVARHPVLFPNYQKGGKEYPVTNEYGWVDIDVNATDTWGCRWHHNIQGIIGQVVGHPLLEWDSFAAYAPPDPMTQDAWGNRDWIKEGEQIAATRAHGDWTFGELGHGFLFMRLHDLRGYENLMVDFGTEEPRLQALIDMLVAYHRVVVEQYLRLDVDVISAGDDLGTQTASMVSPATFRKWITPAYQQVFGPARAAGKHVLLHSDGHTIELMDEFIASGVTICNPQDLCNGIDEIKAAVDGRICIRLDIDRQSVVPFGTPREIRDLVEEAVRKLGSPRGGLELIVGIYPPTPPENIDALFSAFEEFHTYWFDGRGKE